MSKRKERIAEKQKQQKMKTIWFSFALIIIVAAVTVWWFTMPDAQEPDVQTTAEIRVGDDEWTLGNPDADIVLVEYADFQCGACAYYHPIIKELMEEYDDQVLYVFRHFPLTNIHQYATLAARTAEAAGKQGRFWEMTDLIFQNQQRWSRGNAPFEFTGYARELGLDMNRFQNDLGAAETFQRVEQSFNSGMRLNITSVPSFFINGEKIMNPRTLDEFRSVIDRRLEGN
ncbi:MAG: DsbA family protein [Balneolaceae bacterium]|nr:MAG: DsbA family protein [Balneolaceae bacterium]